MDFNFLVKAPEPVAPHKWQALKRRLLDKQVDFINRLREVGEDEAFALLKEEVTNKARKNTVMRTYQRFAKARREREWAELERLCKEQRAAANENFRL